MPPRHRQFRKNIVRKSREPSDRVNLLEKDPSVVNVKPSRKIKKIRKNHVEIPKGEDPVEIPKKDHFFWLTLFVSHTTGYHCFESTQGWHKFTGN